MGRALTIAAAFVLVVAACGGEAGDDDSGADDAPATTQAVTTQPNEDAEPSPTETMAPGNDDGADTDASGPSTATVTIDGETYLFSSEGAVVAQCLTDLFGLFSVQLPRVDESGGSADGNLQLFILHEGTDPEVVGQVNAIEVGIEDDDWVADEASTMLEQSDFLEPGMSQVDTAEVDGRTVRGTATFFSLNDAFAGEAVTATGSFEATCGEERTS